MACYTLSSGATSEIVRSKSIPVEVSLSRGDVGVALDVAGFGSNGQSLT